MIGRGRGCAQIADIAQPLQAQGFDLCRKSLQLTTGCLEACRRAFIGFASLATACTGAIQATGFQVGLAFHGRPGCRGDIDKRLEALGCKGGFTTAQDGRSLALAKPAAQAAAPSHAPAAITLESVCCRFEELGAAQEGGGDAAALCDVSFHLTAGSVTVLTGASGAGKTTLLDVLTGLLLPDSGRILVDGNALDMPDFIASHRLGLAYVTQQPVFFDASLWENIIWLAADATPEELDAALTLAGLDGLLQRLPKGKETRLGVGGQLLSGGELQRLALARAVLRSPRLLVLDEALNAVDMQTEARILSRLFARKSEMTILMVTHRAISNSVVDQVLHIEGGRVSVQDPTDTDRNLLTGGTLALS